MKPSKTALFDAAKRWDAAAVAAILKAAPALATAADPKGRMALHIACAVPPALSSASRTASRPSRPCSRPAHRSRRTCRCPRRKATSAPTRCGTRPRAGVNLPLVRFLLKRGGDPSYSLWTVVFRDDADMLRALLTAKPRLNLRAHGETPIFCAARLQRLKTLDLLIAAGADPAIKDDRGRDAVDIAKARRLPKDVIARLEKMGRPSS